MDKERLQAELEIEHGLRPTQVIYPQQVIEQRRLAVIREQLAAQRSTVPCTRRCIEPAIADEDLDPGIWMWAHSVRHQPGRALHEWAVPVSGRA